MASRVFPPDRMKLSIHKYFHGINIITMYILITLGGVEYEQQLNHDLYFISGVPHTAILGFACILGVRDASGLIKT